MQRKPVDSGTGSACENNPKPEARYASGNQDEKNPNGVIDAPTHCRSKAMISSRVQTSSETQPTFLLQTVAVPTGANLDGGTRIALEEKYCL